MNKITKCVILLIITSKIYLYYNKPGIIRKAMHCFVLYDGALYSKISKWGLTRFAMKLFNYTGEMYTHSTFNGLCGKSARTGNKLESVHS